LLLAGCYESKGMLLDPSVARQPISSYQDWRYGSGDNAYHARLNPRGDGWYNFEEAKIGDDGVDGEWNHHTVLMNYLENDSGNDIYVYGTWDDGEKAYIYGIVFVRGNGNWQSFAPNCNPMASGDWYDSDVAAAQGAGAELADACTFGDAATLFQAMRNVVAAPGFWKRVDEASQ
jgi:hypothetical protein